MTRYFFTLPFAVKIVTKAGSVNGVSIGRRHGLFQGVDKIVHRRGQFFLFPLVTTAARCSRRFPLSKFLQAEQTHDGSTRPPAAGFCLRFVHPNEITASPLPVPMVAVRHCLPCGGLASVKLRSHRMIMNDNSAPAAGTTTNPVPASTPNVRVWLVDSNDRDPEAGGRSARPSGRH